MAEFYITKKSLGEKGGAQTLLTGSGVRVSEWPMFYYLTVFRIPLFKISKILDPSLLICNYILKNIEGRIYLMWGTVPDKSKTFDVFDAVVRGITLWSDQKWVNLVLSMVNSVLILALLFDRQNQ